MQAPDLPKSIDVAAPANDSDLPPINGKHKAVILHFMYFSDMAVVGRIHNDKKKTKTLLFCGHIVASSLVKKVYDIDIHPNSIRSYYHQIRANTWEAGFRTDQDFVAEIMSNQLKDYAELLDVVSFVCDLHLVFFPSTSADSRVKRDLLGDVMESFSPTEQFFVEQALRVANDVGWGEPGQEENISQATIELKAYWRGAAKNPRINIVEPELKQSRNLQVPRVIDLEVLQDFEQASAWL